MVTSIVLKSISWRHCFVSIVSKTHLLGLQSCSSRNFQTNFAIKCQNRFSIKMIENICKMSTDQATQVSAQIWPPKHVFDMKTLDPDQFRKTINLPFVVATNEHLPTASKALKPYFLKIQNLKPVQRFQTDQHKILLNPDLVCEELSSRVKELRSKKVLVDSTTDGDFEHENFELKYENFTYHMVLRAILPPEVDSISGFSTIGHIIHLNLRENALPYKNVIGQVLMDKIKGCRLVVNKLNIIEKRFRNFEMEILAQEDSEVSTVVSTTESNIKFKFDFAKVYWNPRLSMERERISVKLSEDVDIVYDVFAGVGPFALFAAKFRKCQVFANDLNPDSYQWLTENVKINKVTKLVKCSNLDGREFITTVLKDHLITEVANFDGSNTNRRYHVIMNLPEIAITFLDAFVGLLSSDRSQHRISSLNIHCYCFVKNIPEDEANQYVIDLTSKNLGHRIDDYVDEVLYVRKVAPNKIMYRISFELREEILYGQEFPNPKRFKTE